MEKSYLNPEVAARLSNLELIARLVVEGFITGLHKSPYHGFSVEFAEHRPYMPGDEIRSIDWKVYGRTGRYYVKRFEEETNLKSYILVDTSGSMSYGSGGITKNQYAMHLAASLSYLMIHQKDAAGLVLFDNAIQKLLPPRATRSYIRTLEVAMTASPVQNETGIGNVLHQVAERLKRRGLIILISDLMDDPDNVINGLKHFRHDRHDVIVFHVLDPAERHLTFDGDVIFEDAETGEKIATQPWHIRKAYREQMDGFTERYRRACREANVDYVLLDTQTSYDKALLEYLIKRSRLN